MPDPRSTLIFSLHRPYFDLGPIEGEAPIASWYPLLGYESLEGGLPHVGQRQIREEFRLGLLAESGATEYACLDPRELSEELATDRWLRVCELVDDFETLDPMVQARLARLLLALGFHRLILGLLPRDLPVVDEGSAARSYMRTMAKHCLHVGWSKAYPTAELERVIANAPPLCRTRFSAAMTLLTAESKFTKNVEAVRRLRDIGATYIEYLERSLGEGSFDYHFFVSRFYRAVSYLPYLVREFDAARAEMELCEEHARAIPVQTPSERVVARDNLYIALESQMRVVLAQGNVTRARELADEIVDIDPWDSRTHFERAEVLLRVGDTAAAAEDYRAATRFSPPGTAAAYYMLGHCLEQLGELEHALDSYRHALAVDPGGITSATALQRLAARLGEKPLEHWARQKVASHEAAGLLDPGELPELEPTAVPARLERAGA
jgi:tetratricopeptide (TPR) repeat protein